MRLIDADVLINTLQELFEKRDKEARFTGDRGVTVTWNDAIYHIKTAPTIEERKTGKWLTSDDLYETGICSCCKQDSQEPVSYAVTNFHYCPNCGSDMRGEGHE